MMKDCIENSKKFFNKNFNKKAGQSISKSFLFVLTFVCAK